MLDIAVKNTLKQYFSPEENGVLISYMVIEKSQFLFWGVYYSPPCMDLSKPANTYVGYQKALENFFTPPKGESDSRSKYLSGELKIISVLTWPEEVWTSITLTFGWREKVSRAF